MRIRWDDSSIQEIDYFDIVHSWSDFENHPEKMDFSIEMGFQGNVEYIGEFRMDLMTVIEAKLLEKQMVDSLMVKGYLDMREYDKIELY